MDNRYIISKWTLISQSSLERSQRSWKRHSLGTEPAGISEWTGEEDSHFAFSTVPPQLSTWRSDPPGLRRRAQGPFSDGLVMSTSREASSMTISRGKEANRRNTSSGVRSEFRATWGQVRVPSNLHGEFGEDCKHQKRPPQYIGTMSWRCTQ